MNKDYMTTDERKTFIVFKKAIDNAEEILNHWKISKEEHKNLKSCITFGMKFFDSVAESLSNKALDTLIKSVKKSNLTIEDKYAVEVYNKKIGSNLDDMFEENADYYKLVELTMAYNCNGCNSSCKTCELCEEFEAHLIPSGGYGHENCKYSYD